MAITLIAFLALSVFVAHCNVIHEESIISEKLEQKREKRSCHDCDNKLRGLPSAPPPPPPIFDPAKNAFSSASAGAHTGHSFSGASASASSNSGIYQKQSHSNDNRFLKNAGFQNGKHRDGFGNQQENDALRNYKVNQNVYQSERNNQIQNQGKSPGASFDAYHQIEMGAHGANAQRQIERTQSKSASSAQVHSSGSGILKNAQQLKVGQSQYQSFSSLRSEENKQQVEPVSSGYLQKSDSEKDTDGVEMGKSRARGEGTPAHDYLNGSPHLASQDLQSKQSGCSTCGKTGLSQSNAKSHSGNAIALAVNG